MNYSMHITLLKKVLFIQGITKLKTSLFSIGIVKRQVGTTFLMIKRESLRPLKTVFDLA